MTKAGATDAQAATGDLKARSPVARRSVLTHRFMVAYFDRFFRRHMNGLHVANWGLPPAADSSQQFIVYSNHPAWWDAAIYVLAADSFLPRHESFAPIDAEMLERYGVLGRIGAFGVDLESPRGAAQFLDASRDILSAPNRALWITAQGGFSDARTRPLGLKAGVARLTEIAPDAIVVPLAIEYSFWLERGAEAFMAFGRPLRGEDLNGMSRTHRLTRLEEALTQTLDALSDDVRTRDPARFRSVLKGRSGIGGVYDAWRRATGFLRGRRFDASHEGHSS